MEVIFIIAGVISLTLVFLGVYFIYRIIIKFYNFSGRASVIFLRAIFILAPLSFILSTVLLNRYFNSLIRIYYSASAVVMGFIFYAFFTCLAAYLIDKFLPAKFSRKSLISLMLVLAAAVTVYGMAEARNIKVKRLELTLPNLPSGWQGKTAVWISDLHLDAVNNMSFARRVAAEVNGSRPDILFIGGDFYDGQKNINLAELAGAFSPIYVPEGKYFITGNHEEFDGNTEFIKAITGAGIVYLNNQIIDIKGLQILGVDYRKAYDRASFAKILSDMKIDKSRPSILLRHVPDKVDVAANAGISLMLSGHAHKGQLFPIELIETFIYNGFEYGFNRYDQTQVYTSSGVGTWGPPLRVLAKPEIVEIKLK